MLRTLLIDDEAAARSRLTKLLAVHPEITLIGEAENGFQAIEMIETLTPDLVFLDIQMPGLTGFQVLQAISGHEPTPLVIVATAFDEFAMAAFEANAVGYLLKPINRERLRVAVERAAKIAANAAERQAEQNHLSQAARHLSPTLQQIVARQKQRVFLLPLEEICFFQIEDGILKAKTEAGWFSTTYQLSDLEGQLPASHFFRANRGAIVNLHKVKEIAPLFKSTFALIFQDPERSEIQVSERQSKHLRELLQGL